MSINKVTTTDTLSQGRAKWNANDELLETNINNLVSGLTPFADNIAIKTVTQEAYALNIGGNVNFTGTLYQDGTQ